MATLAPDMSRFAAGPAVLPFRSGLRILPLLLVLSYLSTLLALFLVWPINWQIYYASSWALLTGYIIACYALIAVGYMFATQPATHVAHPFPYRSAVIIGGAIIAAILLTPLSYVYTGRYPWQVLEAAQQQGDAYRALQEQLQQTAGQRSVIAFIRATLAPITFAVVPLGIIHWGRISWIARGAVGLSVLITIVFSLLRGTDREFADLLIVSFGALMVALGRSQGENANWLFVLVRRYWGIVVVGVFFLTFAASLFTERKSERLGGFDNRTTVCANVSRICADVDAPAIAWMPVDQRFATSLFILSSASGFYGLELAMEKDFQSTYGIGHSPASLAIYELITGDDQLKRRTFTYRNSFDGWSDENYWSTLMTWIANDVGFTGTLVVILFIGWATGRAWRAATLSESDPASIIFCALMITLFYLSANNQLLGGYDGYFVVTVWTVLWLREKRTSVSALLRG